MTCTNIEGTNFSTVLMGAEEEAVEKWIHLSLALGTVTQANTNIHVQSIVFHEASHQGGGDLTVKSSEIEPNLSVLIVKK